jgi:cytochrome c biogenesis protein
MSIPTDVEPAAGAGGAARNPAPPTSPPALKPVELARWAWRQLTSMRTALVLLFLLAVAAVPGSVVPQQDIDAIAVGDWKSAHPTLTPVYEFLGLFSVYDSAWFSAIYILLMVSLVGCIVPRLRIYWRGMRARPPGAPRNLSRLPESRRFEVDGSPDEVLARAERVLRKRRYRTVATGSSGSVAGERGYLREAGNLLFHVSVLVVLVGFALGQLYGYKGGVITVVGQGFSNSLSQYDDFAPGSMFSPDDLAPLSLTVDDFDVSFLTAGPQLGQPRDFSADVTYTEEPGADAERYDLRVNHPLKLDGVSVFLVGHGYAPVVTVRDGNGDVAYEGPVVFLPQDASFASFGVLKVPDAAPRQLGFEGLFLPTYGFTMDRGPFSQFPDALDPVLSLVPYQGDLGLDTGAPQSVYQLDKDGLETFASTDASRGSAARVKLSVGDTVDLPDGAGSITFDRVDRWAKLQVSDTPGKGLALGGVLLGIAGLMGSLFIRPRRAWVRARPAGRGGRTVVELAGLDRSSGGDLGTEIDELEQQIRSRPPGNPQEKT